MKHQNSLFLCCILVSSILFVLSVPNFIDFHGIYFFAYIFAIPFFFILDNVKPFKGMLWSFFSGVISYACILYWLFGVSVKGGLVFTCFMSIQLVIFSLLYANMKKNAFFVAGSWVVSEYVRGLLFKGFCWGIGYSQGFNAILNQTADIAGVYGLSFLIIMINFLLYKAIVHKRIRNVFYVAGIFLLMFMYGYYKVNNSPVGEIVVSVVQGNISQQEKWNDAFVEKIKKRYKELSLTIEDRTELLIWPETSLPGDHTKELNDYLLNIMRKKTTDMLFGISVQEDGRFYNRAVLIDQKGKVVGHYDKIKTVPFFEYAPFNNKNFYFFDQYADDPVWFSEGSKKYPIKGREINIGVLICFEDFFDELTRTLVKERSDILVNITNDALFGRSAASYLHLQASIFRAIENRISVVRSSNTGFSCIINDYGAIIKNIDQQKQSLMVAGAFTDVVQIVKQKTFYRSVGYRFPLLCWALVFIGYTMGKKKRTFHIFSQILMIIILASFVSQEAFSVADPRRMQGQGQAQGQTGKPKKRKIKYVNIDNVKPVVVQAPKDEKRSNNAATMSVDRETGTSSGSQTLSAKANRRSGSLVNGMSKGISQKIEIFNASSSQWKNIPNNSEKADILDYYINVYAQKNIKIKRPASFYVPIVDNLIRQNPSLNSMPLYKILQTVAIMEYDFDNGQDKDLLAKQVLGEKAWKANKERLKRQGKM